MKIFATLSPIPGYMHWLLPKFASQIKLSKSESEDMKHFSEKCSGSNFIEDLLLPEEKEMILSGYLKWLQSGTASEIEFDKSECMDTRYMAIKEYSKIFRNDILLPEDEMITSLTFMALYIDQHHMTFVVHRIKVV